MTDISRITPPETLNSEDVLRYLEDNPEFFRCHPESLQHIRVSHDERGTVSLVEAQLDRLRTRVTELEEEITQLMGIAAGNEQLFRSFSVAHQALFTANELSDVHTALATLAERLQLKVSLRLYQTNEPSPLTRQSVDKLCASRFSGQRLYLGRLRRQEGEIFVSEAPELGSYAILPIFFSQELGFLTFASQDGGHFQPSMDTLFLEQLADHIAVLLSRWQVEV
ncbi:DUF484 family protein [Veronia pacifica]|uniref:3',5'-cyclic-nucleotide phosphodiesterase n=1 Tax=Veronia pacifica TaxID=1080227 RepID=A0A1C3EJL8_9GAMM|nr:DUF484 family protein [Veronia pacifica]ODA33424.1 hypothetical protein A8L45_10260 [Veronia pacifica]